MRVEVFVHAERLGLPRLAGGAVHGVEPVGGGLVAAHQAEVAAGRCPPHDLLDECAERARGLVEGGARPVHGHGEVLQRWQGQLAQHQSPVGVRGGAQASAPLGDAGQDVGQRPPVGPEEFLGAVRTQPLLQYAQMLRVVMDSGERDLVGAPGVLHRHAVDLAGTGPALRGPQHDHRPERAFTGALLASSPLKLGDPVERQVARGGHGAVHLGRVVTGHVNRRVAVAPHQRVEFRPGKAGQDGGIGDLVAVEVEDRQHGPVVDGVEELVGVPGGGQRPGLRLAVADHTHDHQAGVVERRAVGVGEAVAQLAALVNGARDLRGDVTGHTTREGELAKHPLHAGEIHGDVRIDLAVGALQPGVGDDGGPAVSWPPDRQYVGPAGPDHPVQMCVQRFSPGEVPQWPRSRRLMCPGLSGSVSSGLESR